ncbi:MAG: squalene/phytoene synthase family protein, partial [Pseudomonadota bacterium]
MLETLRDTDREAYLASLFLAADVREDFATLWAFNAEIERIRNLISEPVPGEIRLQWWRDVISGDRAGEGAQHP